MFEISGPRDARFSDSPLERSALVPLAACAATATTPNPTFGRSAVRTIGAELSGVTDRRAIAIPVEDVVHRGWSTCGRTVPPSTLIDDPNRAAFRATSDGVADDVASCHTAIVGEYTIEGHVPVGAISRLLADRPDAIGLALPGMPTDRQVWAATPVPGNDSRWYSLELTANSPNSTTERAWGSPPAAPHLPLILNRNTAEHACVATVLC